MPCLGVYCGPSVGPLLSAHLHSGVPAVPPHTTAPVWGGVKGLMHTSAIGLCLWVVQLVKYFYFLETVLLVQNNAMQLPVSMCVFIDFEFLYP